MIFLKKIFRAIQIGSPLFVPVFGLIAREAISGIIGNRADDLLVNFIKKNISFLSYTISINKAIQIEAWLLVLFLFSLFPSYIIYSQFSRAHKVAVEFNELDELSMIMIQQLRKNYKHVQLVPGSNTPADAEKALKRFLEQVLNKTSRAFSLYGECSSHIYLPNCSDSYLHPWCRSTSSRGPHIESCYFGSSDHPPKDLVSYTFEDRKIRLAHIERKGNQWISDNQDFRFVNEMQYEPMFPYRAQISVPIIIEEETSQKSIGVLSLYSMDKDVFDDLAVQSMVDSVAKRISYILAMTVEDQSRIL
jgi:hypothetical protein